MYFHNTSTLKSKLSFIGKMRWFWFHDFSDNIKKVLPMLGMFSQMIWAKLTLRISLSCSRVKEEGGISFSYQYRSPNFEGKMKIKTYDIIYSFFKKQKFREMALTCFVIIHLSTQKTSKCRSDYSSFCWHFC